MARARKLLADPGQGEFDLGIAPGAPRATLVGSADTGLFEVAGSSERGPAVVAAARVVSTASRVLYEALASVFTSLGFDAVGDKVFRDLVIARIVEPTSIRDTGRVLADLGCQPASEKTMRRNLTRAHRRIPGPDRAAALRPRHEQRRRQPVPVRRDHVLLRSRERGRPAQGRYSK